mmetsp:Transcript_55432/g.81492  ORF Transcript_55432/g.81492 Transcript_55432/m.81492 type:complete len:267 (-) Transcript_55432:1011-1811(-)
MRRSPPFVFVVFVSIVEHRYVIQRCCLLSSRVNEDEITLHCLFESVQTYPGASHGVPNKALVGVYVHEPHVAWQILHSIDVTGHAMFGIPLENGAFRMHISREILQRLFGVLFLFESFAHTRGLLLFARARPQNEIGGCGKIVKQDRTADVVCCHRRCAKALETIVVDETFCAERVTRLFELRRIGLHVTQRQFETVAVKGPEAQRVSAVHHITDCHAKFDFAVDSNDVPAIGAGESDVLRCASAPIFRARICKLARRKLCDATQL